MGRGEEGGRRGGEEGRRGKVSGVFSLILSSSFFFGCLFFFRVLVVKILAAEIFAPFIFFLFFFPQMIVTEKSDLYGENLFVFVLLLSLIVCGYCIVSFK